MAKKISIVEQLRAAIRQAERQGMSRYRLARLAGVSESQLSKFMLRQRAPRLDTAEKIVAALGKRIIIA